MFTRDGQLTIAIQRQHAPHSTRIDLEIRPAQAAFEGDFPQAGGAVASAARMKRSVILGNVGRNPGFQLLPGYLLLLLPNILLSGFGKGMMQRQ